MRLLTIILISIIGIVPFSAQCQKLDKPLAKGVHKVLIQEVLQTSAYTYLNVKEDTSHQWIAVPRMEVKTGETCYHTGGMEMTDFKSKELNRTFHSVLFMDGVSMTPDGSDKKGMEVPNHNSKPKLVKKEIKIEPAKGGISIAGLYQKKDAYAGKKVRVKGQVMKFNEGIMGKNWAHLQDGSSAGEDFDLTVTLAATLKVGDVVTVEGKITLNKDFGSGYFFKLIMEDAVILP